jgi:hypothetical protein
MSLQHEPHLGAAFFAEPPEETQLRFRLTLRAAAQILLIPALGW